MHRVCSVFVIFTTLVANVHAATTITTVAGTGLPGFSGEGGAATAADLNQPRSVAVDSSGNIYFADAANCRVRKVTASPTGGIITTVAGNGVADWTGDGGLATSASIGNPAGVALDASGNLYVSHECAVRKIDAFGIITTVAGDISIGDHPGFSGDGGPATSARLANTYGAVAFDVVGNMYIPDRANQRIRKVDTSGIITTIAGNGITGFFGDGGLALNAQINFPSGVVVDAAGNIFIADGNSCIRKVDVSGVITTVAGIGLSPGYSGDGGPATSAQLDGAADIGLDGSGNLYIADANNRVRMVDTTGMISTIAGTATQGFSGDGGAAASANLNQPVGIAVVSQGSFYIADMANVRIRQVSSAAVLAADQFIRVHPGSSKPISLAASDFPLNDPVTYSMVTPPAHGVLTGTLPNLTYAPTEYAGSDSFTFKANNGSADSNIATVSIAVTDAAPVANNRSFTVHTGADLPIALNAADADGDALTFTVVTPPGHGSLSGLPPNITYTSGRYAGLESFTYKASDGALDSNIATVSITVINQPPTISSISGTPAIATEGQSVVFTAAANDPDGDPLSFLWDFGDGSTATDQNPTHSYAAAGVYQVTVIVTDIANASVTSNDVTIQVFDDADRPAARFVSSDLNGFVGQPVGFDASFSTDPLNNIVSYDWDFGDGSPHGSQQIISRVYTAEGTYTVALTITDGRGLSDTTTLTMVILAAGQAGLLNPNIKYSVSWNRTATNTDSLSLSATVNVGTTAVTQTSPLSLNVVGQTFTGSSATPLSFTRSSKSAAQGKWQIKASRKKGSPKGTYDLKCTIKHASLGQAFALAGVTGTKSSTAKIPLRLGIGGSSFESSISSQFRFGSNGAKASGGGFGPK